MDAANMVDAARRKPGQPKLRASCDHCGSLKLRCDRGQPQCGRCVSMGITCVYGVSRKTGKPTRSASRTINGGDLLQARPVHERRGSHDQWKSAYHPCRDVFPGSVRHRSEGYFVNDAASTSTTDSSIATWSAMDVDLSHVHPLDSLHAGLLGDSLRDFSTFDFGEDLVTTAGTEAFLAAPTSVSLPNGGMTISTLPPRRLTRPSPDMETSRQCPTGYHCSREAYDILGRLDFYHDSAASNLLPRSGTVTPNRAEKIPLEYLLCLNSESCRRLTALLDCPCARHPHLALLYASILSRVLMWYREAARCVDAAAVPCDQGAVLSEALRSTRSPSSSSSSLRDSLSRSVTSSAKTDITTTTNSSTTSPSPPHFMTAPVAMGAFSNDDQQVQMSLRIHFLLGETKKIGALIDLFTTRCSTGADGGALTRTDEVCSTVRDSLHQEQSTIAQLLRSRLNEIKL